MAKAPRKPQHRVNADFHVSGETFTVRERPDLVRFWIDKMADRARLEIQQTLLRWSGSQEFVLDQDGGGLRMRVPVHVVDMPMAMEWQKKFGRSYGPIRIYLVEAQ